jgi:hypothetical protein
MTSTTPVTLPKEVAMVSHLLESYEPFAGAGEVDSLCCMRRSRAFSEASARF